MCTIHRPPLRRKKEICVAGWGPAVFASFHISGNQMEICHNPVAFIKRTVEAAKGKDMGKFRLRIEPLIISSF